MTTLRALTNVDAATAVWMRLVEAVSDPLARKVLDLHCRDSNGYCQGDEYDGEWPQSPNWPCATVELVMDHLDQPAPAAASDSAWHWQRQRLG